MQRLEGYSFTPVVNQHDSDHELSRNIPCDISNDTFPTVRSWIKIMLALVLS
jgi:hypothetical protein